MERPIYFLINKSKIQFSFNTYKILDTYMQQFVRHGGEVYAFFFKKQNWKNQTCNKSSSLNS